MYCWAQRPCSREREFGLNFWSEVRRTSTLGARIDDVESRLAVGPPDLAKIVQNSIMAICPLTLCTLCTTLKEMSTAYVSGRVPARYERLVAKQARAAKTSKSDLVARYVIEKSLETEFPGISFRDSLSGREAYLTGHRVAVWEVLSVHDETKSVDKTAEHFHWPRALVKRALAYAKAFPEEVSSSREGETDAVPAAG